MAISFVNKSAFASGTTALSVGAVASVVAGDLLLLFVESANQPVAAPSGWTQVTNSPIATGTANAAGGVALQIFYQFATGADTTTSVADSGDHTTAIKIAYRGVDQTTPFAATPVSGTKATASTTTTFPAITTATANALVVLATGLDLDAASTATTGTITNANLTSITERHDQTVTSGFGGGLVIADGFKATAGSTGTSTATVTSTVQVYLTLALKPLAARTGTLAVTETGIDTFASSGEVIVEGPLAVSETSSDTFAATGVLAAGANTGTMSVTETGADTASASGKVLIKGSLAKAETGVDTATASGKVFIKGSLSSTETGIDTISSSGKVFIKGSWSSTESGTDTFSATGFQSLLGITGSMSVSEAGDDTAFADGKVLIKGSFSIIETDTDVFAGNGSESIFGTLNATETSDIITASGSVTYSTITGVMAAVESGGQTGFGVNAVMKYYTGSQWVILYKDPTVYQ